MSAPTAIAVPMTDVSRRRRVRVNWPLTLGVTILLLVALLGLVGPFFVDTTLSAVGSVEPNQRPSREHLLGTEVQGRDVFATLILGIPQTLKIGLIAGLVGLSVGVVLGLMAGYLGGAVDAVIRVATDVFLTIPALAILIVVASSLRVLSIEAMALIVASLAWMAPTRAIRAQVLTLRERQYIQMAKLSGQNDIEIIFGDILPNLIPYIAATLVLSVSSAILAAIGLEVLGLGPSHLPSLGMLIFWSQFYDAVFRGLWWWYLPPIVVLVLIFVGLFLLSMGLDQISNPRLRQN